MEKICTCCKTPKPIEYFYNQKDRKTGSSYCKSCFNKFCIKRWQDRKIQAIEYLGGKCIDCDKSHPEYPFVIFDFHHLNLYEKDYDWNKLRLKSWDKIKTELDKCILLCSNCHRIRHFKEHLENKILNNISNNS